MAYLLYGIMKGLAVSDKPIVTGVKGTPVTLVHAHRLCAAVSPASADEGAPAVAELLAYGRVVEELHGRQAVIPMRYGCFLDGIPEIQRLLKDRKRQYQSLLDELEGRVEMGIRILLPEAGMLQPPEGQPVNGRDFLLLRKAHYRMGAEASQQHRMLMERYVQAFVGLYDKHRTETATHNGEVVLSLYFLAPAHAVQPFQAAFNRLVENGEAQAILSGPWPPYNFVTPDPALIGESDHGLDE